MENMSGITFWGNTEATNTPRALYIGDSVSCVTRNRVTAAEANNVLLFDGIGASKAVERLILVPTRFSQVLARCMLPTSDLRRVLTNMAMELQNLRQRLSRRIAERYNYGIQTD